MRISLVIVVVRVPGGGPEAVSVAVIVAYSIDSDVSIEARG